MQKKTMTIKAILLIVAAMLPCFLNKTFALAANDCDVITGNIANFKSIVFKNIALEGKILPISNVYSGDALDRAIRNLTAYCCKDILKQWNKGPDARCKDSGKLPDDWPDSPYLFDHLVDVGLRRLDVLNNYSDVQPDPTWYARRTFITGVATNPSIIVPKTITDAYSKYRTLSGAWMFKKIHLKIENMDATELWKLQNFLTGYNNENKISLADKYNNLCRIARNIYEKKPWQKITIWGDKLSKGRSYYTDCQNMVAKRINQENTYVKGILINKATDMLQKNFQAIHKQFVQDKLTTLQTTISNIRDMIQTVVNQAPYCAKCSK